MPPESQPSFFKRELPASCTDFASPAGRQLFTQALSEGHMEIYFKVSQHLSAQSDPAFCGLATLTMALNALGVDPMRKWKGRQGYWRFFTDDMLDCCRTLDDVRAQGITLTEFKCLAACNGLDATLVGGAEGFKGIEAFERAVKQACSSQQQVLAVSFSRQVLEQTGTGHFSCIGGYCEASRQVLLLETALFKYPTYWINIDKLYEAMLPQDPATGLPRGYFVLKEHVSQLPPSSPTSSILSLNFHKNSWSNLVNEVSNELKSVESPTLSQLIAAIQKATPTPLLVRIMDKPDRPGYQELVDGLMAKAQALDPSETPRAILFALAFAFSQPKKLFGRDLLSSAEDMVAQDAQLESEVRELARLMKELDQCCQAEGKACTGCDCEIRHL